MEKQAPIKPVISASILKQLDIRVGKIFTVEDIPNSDKLVRLIVDFGDHRRKILVGLKKERLNPKEIEGMQALFVVNLEPRTDWGNLQKECCLI